MSELKDIFSELRWRGQIHQTTDDANLAEWLMQKPRTVYTGFDPTADSLHVGHLMAIMILRRFQKAGHRPIALVGGATGMIGDPSGKSEERKQLSEDVLAHNVTCLTQQLSRFLDFSDPMTGRVAAGGALLLNNYDWMKDFSHLAFLREIGRYFPVNVMLSKDSIKTRLERENGISYTEFSYMLLQSYDFVHLYRTTGCELQVGGSDQWGNITAGIDLARRMENGVQLYGMTAPLLTKSDGTKMGKSEGGALWLDPQKTSPYQFYQYWINTDDADIEKLLCFATDLSQDVIKAVMTEHRQDPGKRLAQRKAAEEITRLVHAPEGLLIAQRATDIFFGAEISNLDDAALISIFSDVPSYEITRESLNSGVKLTEALVESGLGKTRSEARRFIQQGGAYVNNIRVTDENMLLSAKNLASKSMIVLRTGKKKYALVKIR